MSVCAYSYVPGYVHVHTEARVSGRGQPRISFLLRHCQPWFSLSLWFVENHSGPHAHTGNT